jgi:hypothetical protein
MDMVWLLRYCQPLSSQDRLTKLRNGLNDRLGGGIVAESFADMDETVNVAGRKNETAAELKRILPEFVLAMAAGFCTLAGGGIVLPQQVQKRSLFQAESGIRSALLIYQKRKFDSGFFAERAGIRRVA